MGISQWKKKAVKCNFTIVLWTNLNELAEEEKKSLESLGITFNDYSICEMSRFYRYFLYFLNQGIAGDKAAFGLASDIFRMSLLELAPADQYFIFVDGNDILLPDLENNLNKMMQSFYLNQLGLTFLIIPHPNHPGDYHVSNEVVVALKRINPNFFKDYFEAYKNNLEKTHKQYSRPTTYEEAHTMVALISNQVTNNFFGYYCTGGVVAIFAKFGLYEEPLFSLNCTLLPYKRETQFSNTWIPEKSTLPERQNSELDVNSIITYERLLNPNANTNGEYREHLDSCLKMINEALSKGVITELEVKAIAQKFQTKVHHARDVWDASCELREIKKAISSWREENTECLHAPIGFFNSATNTSSSNLGAKE